ncbi:MAG: pyruvate dehydrogenase complex dihydrolipoamide acetyltransferase [Acetobacter fabarum]|jgi:pyruvate dehydrogenase E2 component (dihydrolipoamide acetyltransferase)|uniref:pyruvate dehydrogenase complex dihydrolipoamide acetyltransferase n=1 Tax=Acetobacter fabarum TaxID=483199 RepID=UPI0024319557|nr:pyruvate dehydrogenase complex dihydrolipoamide acetyltransferase [Acetobacter fabarum]MCH4026671.1 pyruvate dehydrogenase complex dihydrolipoamide acetyltransferase [Acetobacter fabarum]MCH4056082.1 pyruvate dehydrogenase complex dihydrolipoamide acetyltransferase [Acetobacter fabarum]MCH4085468.1 pyruvate dehydrogenase complex dihydrolipoamide acetyltransferase [Acetobacter fabarum]MCH4126988.1 pyruvate dehydrogenase complex dihydrolipoamide acetyltransferase [Acetobacter fabarum]MCH41372
MAIEILMPALSPTMTEGKIARWLKKEGDTVSNGDVLAEIETDKATMEVEAIEDGIFGRILVPEGTEGVAVNTPIAIMVEEGEAVPDSAAPPATSAAPAPAQAGAVAPSAAPASAPVAPAAALQASRPANRIVASPLARRIAAAKNVDLSTLKGTGPNGRIVKRDVEAAAAQPAAAPKPGQQANAPLPTGASRTVPHTTMRKVIARRLSESKATIPHFYVSMDVELDALMALRSQLNALSHDEGQDAFKLSVNDMLIKAAALALKQVPEVNASFTEDAMILHEDADISVAVSLDDGLITPIVRAADRKSLKQISQEAKSLVSRARAGKLKPEEFQGGTFSISNMGMFGVKEFAAIVNPPQAAILAIAAGKRQPVVSGDEIKVATVMTVTLSVDHRAVDGAMAAKWLSAFRNIVQAPLALVL